MLLVPCRRGGAVTTAAVTLSNSIRRLPGVVAMGRRCVRLGCVVISALALGVVRWRCFLLRRCSRSWLIWWEINGAIWQSQAGVEEWPWRIIQRIGLREGES